MQLLKGFFMFLVLTVFVVGCQSGTDEGGADGGEGEETLVWNTTAGYSPQATQTAVADYIGESVDAVDSEYPEFTFEPSIMSTNIAEAMARLLEQANQGRAPALSAIDSYLFPQYIEYLQPLDEMIEAKGLNVDDFLPFAKDTITGPDGKIYGLYMSTDTRVLFYNTEVISEPPTTWDEVIEIGEGLVEEGYAGISLPGGRGEGASVTTLWPLFWGQGGELIDQEGNPAFGEGENKEYMVNVLETMHRAVEAGVLPQRVAGYGGENDQNEEIAAGNVAMFIGGNWQESFIRENLGEEEFEKWAVAPLPTIEGAERATTAGGWAWGIFTEDPEEQQAAFDLIYETFISEEGMGEFTSVQGSLPARSSVYESESYEGTKFSDEYRDMLNDHARVRPASPHYPEISNQMQIALSAVISGSKEPEQAVEDAWEAVINE